MPSQPHNPSSQSFDGLEPELAPGDPVERRLLADGARWRAQSAPAVEPFARRVNAALRESRLQADTSVEERSMSQRIVTPPPRVASQPPRRRPGKWGTLVAVAAAVVVVAMLAWVFQSISHSHLASRSATPTPDYAAHITHPRGHWADVLEYNEANATVTVAPSDPRVAYRAIPSLSNPTVTALARTDDGGATWTTLALPTDDGGWFGGLAFSPLDPQTVFLTLFSDQSNPHCPAYALPPGTDVGPAALRASSLLHASTQLGPLHPISGGYSCSFQYVSHDGGAHWSHPAFPWQAQHLADLGGALGAPVLAQGSMLFAAVTDNLNGQAFDGMRLAASRDGGTSWTAADSAIFAAGQIVTSYTAIPGTTTLYAMSVPQQTPAGQESTAMLWSSQDAGLHWARVGPAPLAQADLMGAVVPGFGSILYAGGLNPTGPDDPLPDYFSRDGGRTWAHVPGDGRPQGLRTGPPLTTMADGSLLLVFSDAPPPSPPGTSVSTGNITDSFYAWRPGDSAWFQVTPTIVTPSSNLWTQSWLTTPANSPQTLWIVVHPQQGTTYTVRKCVLD
ncbi:MAG TPA: sialidase family protein [Ktedonobacterales bacterium]